MTSSWCDKLASTAGVGFKLNAHFAPSDTILSGMAPILDPLYQKDKQGFTVNQQTSFEVQLLTDEGYQYIVEPTRVAVSFKHRMRTRQVSGGPPVMEMLSRPLPYTELLKDVSRRLVEVALLAPKAKSRSVNRVGIVSTTAVSEDELPPGIAGFIEYMSGPWSRSVDHYNFSITAYVGEGPGWRDRCIHHIVKSDDKDQLMSLNFDYQRIFTTGHSLTTQSLNDILERSEKSALRYFEDLGEGRRFDAKIISESAAV